MITKGSWKIYIFISDNDYDTTKYYIMIRDAIEYDVSEYIINGIQFQ